MRMDRLSLHQLPDLRLPLGYFLVAPWFGVAAAVFILGAGETLWMSRWTPATLGAVHLLVLGCLTMVMMGALVQVLPVISSATVQGATRAGPWIRAGLGTGAVSLAFALTFAITPLFLLAGVALAFAFGWYFVQLVPCLIGRIGGGDSVLSIRVAVACLLVTVGWGLVLLAGHVDPELVPGFRAHTTMHLGFGLLGWVSLLIAAVSFQVLPMFFVAPDYPRWITLGLPLGLPIGILLGNTWIVGTGLLCYALVTLRLLHRRKRRAPDPTVRFWQAAAAILAVSVLVGWSLSVPELLLGVLFLVGFVLTVMVGMLYKIVPFLVFLHLQRATLAAAAPGEIPSVASLPTMHEVVAPHRARRQLQIHGAALVLCLAAVEWPAVGPAAALALLADFAWLGVSVLRGARCHERHAAQIGQET